MLQSLTNGIKMLLSSYAKSINKREQKSGNLFQQKTKSTCIENKDAAYPLNAFNYIHRNSWKAGLVSRMEDWEFSSFRDYIGFRNGQLCNRDLAHQLLDLSEKHLYEESYKMISKDLEDKLFGNIDD